MKKGNNMKRILLLLILIIFVISTTGCSTYRIPITNEVIEEKMQTVEETIIEEKVGDYLLFKTSNENEYLNFLTSFDETKYEIVHISTFAHETSNSWHDDYYMITYKVIAE